LLPGIALNKALCFGLNKHNGKLNWKSDAAICLCFFNKNPPTNMQDVLIFWCKGLPVSHCERPFISESQNVLSYFLIFKKWDEAHEIILSVCLYASHALIRLLCVYSLKRACVYQAVA
jgi:hypothetical protein